MKKKATMILTALLALLGGVQAYADSSGAWSRHTGTLDVSGTDVTISTAAQLAQLARLVNNGTEEFAGKTVTLTADIDLSAYVWVPIGVVADGTTATDRAFKGTFDGAGHTISGARMESFDAVGTYGGLFANLEGTVKDLKMAGSRLYGANGIGAIAARGGSTSLIENCSAGSDVRIDCLRSMAGSGSGGIVGKTAGTVRGCYSAVTFTIYYSTSEGAHIGGIAGATDTDTDGNDNSSITDCLYVDTSALLHDTFAPIKGSGEGTVENCHYHPSTLANGDGAYATYRVKSATPNMVLDFLGTTASSYTVSGLARYADAETGMYGMRHDGEYYSQIPDGDVGHTAKFAVAANGGYTVEAVYANGVEQTASAEADTYMINVDANQTVTADLNTAATGLTGKGTALEPYRIASTTDWNTFASLVNGGMSFSGQHVQLATDDVEVSTRRVEFIEPACLVGRENAPFRGTFDGDGHTITFDVDVRVCFTAPFRYVNGATIKNLKVAGTLKNNFNKASYGRQTAGLVGSAKGSCEIASCVVSATVEGNVPGNVSNGGLVADCSGTLGIYGSVFNGKLTNAGCTDVGGFVGYVGRDATLTIRECLFIPTPDDLTVSATGSRTFACHHSEAHTTLRDCYYTTPLGEAQGSPCTAKADGTEAGSDRTPCGGRTYKFVGVYENGLSFNSFYYVTSEEGSGRTITLADATANSGALTAYVGKAVDITISGRTLYKDGSWNTLCLPFSVSAEEMAEDSHPLHGAQLKVLDFDNAYTPDGDIDNEEGTCSTRFDATDGTLHLYFKDAGSIIAGKPYLAKWEATEATQTTSPTFYNVIIEQTAAATEWGEVGVGFHGTFDPAPLVVGSSQNLYLGDANKLYYPSGVASYSVGAFRAYFTVDPSEASALEPEVAVRAIHLHLGDDEQTQGISELTGEKAAYSTAINGKTAGGFDLLGRRVEAQRKGLHIQNGRIAFLPKQ